MTGCQRFSLTPWKSVRYGVRLWNKKRKWQKIFAQARHYESDGNPTAKPTPWGSLGEGDSDCIGLPSSAMPPRSSENRSESRMAVPKFCQVLAIQLGRAYPRTLP